jgi:hypothetical protein
VSPLPRRQVEDPAHHLERSIDRRDGDLVHLEAVLLERLQGLVADVVDRQRADPRVEQLHVPGGVVDARQLATSSGTGSHLRGK